MKARYIARSNPSLLVWFRKELTEIYSRLAGVHSKFASINDNSYWRSGRWVSMLHIGLCRLLPLLAAPCYQLTGNDTSHSSKKSLLASIDSQSNLKNLSFRQSSNIRVMAEVLGAVSGAIGVAGVAVQFAEGIKKICDFCKDVKDAPEELRYEAEQLELLSHVLDGLDTMLQQHPEATGPNGGLSRALQACRRGQAEMVALLAELESSVSRKRGAVRFVLKKVDIRKHLSRIERAKTSLIIAQGVYQTGLMRYGFSHMTTKVEELGMTLSVLAKGASTQPGLLLSTSPCQASLSLQSSIPADDATCVVISQQAKTAPSTGLDDDDVDVELTIASPSSIGRRGRSPATNVKFRPLWPLKLTLDLAINRSKQGWDMSLKVYGTIPESSSFFAACRGGRISDVQQMFTAKRASVYDRDEEGNNCLYHLLWGYFYYNHGFSSGRKITASSFGDLCRLLVSEGADVYTDSQSWRGAVRWLSEPLGKREDLVYDMSITWDIVRLSSCPADFDDQEYVTAREMACLVTSFCNASPEMIRYLQKMIPWRKISIAERPNLLFSISGSFYCCKAASLRTWLGCESPMWSEYAPELRNALCAGILINICSYTGRGDKVQAAEWREFLRGVAPYASQLRLNGPQDLDSEMKFTLWKDGYHFIIMREALHRFYWSPDWLYKARQAQREPRVSNACYSRYSAARAETPEMIQLGLKCFVTELRNLGIDLVSFGDAESRVWRRHPRSESRRLFVWVDFTDSHGITERLYKFRMIGFSYGPNVEDWHAWISNPFDEWAGEFWRGIEEPRVQEVSIPGAYPDSESESESDWDSYDE